jgi:putative methionine-R-sulfoxide reductase with GAF domain
LRPIVRFLTRRDVESKLANLQALTDTRLNQLDIDRLLVELLRRAQEILDADTAAILLLDEGSDELVASAACGIEEEVRQGVRVPVGVGFAGRVAASKNAVMLDRVDATTVSNPILWDKGIRVMLGVPLLAADQAIGVLHVGRLEDRGFTTEDADLLRVVADRIAGAIQADKLSVERAAAELLERSLLPSKLPRCRGFEFAARYVPAAGRTVGGDWYDAFTLPSGELWTVIGDVAGHSLQAAVIMGRIKSALRAFALLGLPPHEVLGLVDRKIELFELDTTVTIACAVISSAADHMRLALAGHPPPVLALPNRDPVFLEVSAGPVLGLDCDVPRSSTAVPLAPGATVVFYTDGLIERRDRDLDAGLEDLRTTVFPGPAHAVAHHIMGHLIGKTEPSDDVALLVFHTTGAE